MARRGGTNFPHFDGIDTYGRRDMAAYALTNRFVLKYREGGGAPRVDYVTVRLGQFYDFFKDTGPSGEKRNLSNLYGEITYKAGSALDMENDFRYDFKSGAIRSVDTDLRYGGRLGAWYVALGQRFTKDTEPSFMPQSRFDFFTPSTDYVSDFDLTGEPGDQTVDFLTVGGGLKITDHWKTDFKVWYDIRNHDLRETDASVSYAAQCWGATLDYRRRPGGGTQVMLFLRLMGIGNVKI